MLGADSAGYAAPRTPPARRRNDTMNRRAHFTDRVQFFVDNGGVRVQRLEQEAIQSAKIARDFFQLLYLFDPVDCRGLTDIKGAGAVLTAQLDHCRG